MNRRLLSVLAIATAFHLQAADVPEFAWVLSAGGAKSDKTRCVNVDSKGNILLTGEFAGPAKFGDTEVPGAGQNDFFVAKADPEGHLLWARTGGGSGIDRGYAVATDTQGNVYVAGHYQSSDAVFGDTKLPFSGGYDLFVAKYDPNGNLLWVRTAGGEGYDYAHAIAIDPKGDVVVSGAVFGNATFGSVNIENPPGGHMFCAKYDSAGALLWVKATTGATSSYGYGIATDAACNIYIGGANSGTGKFGSVELKTPQGQDSLVVKLNAAGEVLWAATNHGEPRCLVHEITCDPQGRVWVSGMFSGKATFGAEVSETTGHKDNDAFIAHYSTDGKLQWVRTGHGPGTDYGLGVATDGKGTSFLTGEFSDTFQLAGSSLTTRGSTDIYVATFDSNGALQWLTQAGGTAGDNAYPMVHDGRGNLILGGAFSGTVRFGEHELKSSGGGDLYATKLKL
jgi:hypothetical protein